MYACQRNRSGAIQKVQEDAARDAMDPEFFRQPVVRSGDVAHRPVARSQWNRFPAAESLVAPVRPSLTIDAFSIDEGRISCKREGGYERKGSK